MAGVDSIFFSASFKNRDFARPASRTSSKVSGVPTGSAASDRQAFAYTNRIVTIRVRMG